MASNVKKSPIIAGLDRIAIVCNSPVSFGGKLTGEDDKNNYILKNRPNENAFLTAQYCGFNVVMYPGSDVGPGQWLAYMEEAIQICQRLGLKLISNSPILNYNTQKPNIPDYASGWPGSFVKPFKDYSALAGWQIMDEPHYLNWHDSYFSSQNQTTPSSPALTNMRINYDLERVP